MTAELYTAITELAANDPKSARRRAESLQSVLPNDPDIPGFMRSVNNLAEAAGLQIRLSQPVAERAEQYYARIPVQLTLHGSFLSLARFFYQVAQLPRVINMENIKLSEPREEYRASWTLLQMRTGLQDRL